MKILVTGANGLLGQTVVKLLLEKQYEVIATGRGEQRVDVHSSSGYIYKEKETKFFQSSRVAAIMRVGYGNFTVFGSYTLTNFFKEGAGPSVRPYSIGLSLSGL